MNKTRLLRLIYCASILSLLYGCAAPKMQFPVTAPAAYPGKTPASLKVENFTSNHSLFGSIFSREIAVAVTKEGFIKVVSTDTDAEAILKGKLTIGDFVVNSWSQSDECIEYQGKKKPIKKTCVTYSYSKKIDIKVQFDVVDKKSKVALVSGSEISRYDETFTGDDASSALTSAPTNDQIINDKIAELAKLVLQVISPHKLTVSRELQGGDDNLKLGIKYAEGGQLDKAIAYWRKSESSSDPKVQAAAYYNIGIIKESEERYEDARRYFEKADTAIPGEDLYIKSMTRVEQAKEQKKKLDKQKTHH